MSKKFQTVFIVIFFVMCLLPVAMLPLSDSSNNSENRKLSEKPVIFSDEGEFNREWSSEFETYLSEHFAFRQQLVTVDGLLRSQVFKSSSNEKVIVGIDDWLFFSSTTDDFEKINTMSVRKVNNTLKTLSLIQEYGASRECQFVFLIAPNKNSVYPEYMPYRYMQIGEKSNRELLLEKAEDYGIISLDVVGLFKSNDEILYHKRDSHWNNMGALIVHNSIMDLFGANYCDFSDVSYSKCDVWSGDLDTMLFPSLNNLSEQVVYDYDFNFEYTSNFNSSDDMVIKTKNDLGNGRILLFRDSFGRSLYPFFAESCNEALFTREVPYKIDLIDSFAPDMVVLEIVERNLSDISENTPVMEAPSRELNTMATVSQNDENTCYVTQYNNYIKIYGTLAPTYFQDDSDIYVTLENENTILCYEAFPICDNSLLEENEKNDYGYSLYISLDEVPKGAYSINAYIGDKDNLVCTDALQMLSIE